MSVTLVDKCLSSLEYIDGYIPVRAEKSLRILRDEIWCRGGDQGERFVRSIVQGNWLDAEQTHFRLPVHNQGNRYCLLRLGAEVKSER